MVRPGEDMDRLTREIDRLTADVRKLGEKVASLKEAATEDGEAARELRDWITVERVTIRFEAWFRAKAPEYEVIRWFKAGVDLLIEGKGILAAVEITDVPYLEAVDKIKSGTGAVEEAWGREPDVLIIWSESGVAPPEVAEYAAKRGVEVVKGERELKRLLDSVAGARPTA